MIDSCSLWAKLALQNYKIRGVYSVGRRTRYLIGFVLLMPIVVLAFSTLHPAAAHEGHIHENEALVIDVVEVHGLLDPVLLKVVSNALKAVDPSETIALVLQVDSRGAVVPESDIVDLARLLVDSPVPVSVWVGPSGSRALGAVAQLVGLADDVGMAPGARIGDLGEYVFPSDRFGKPFGLSSDSVIADTTIGYEVGVESGFVRSSPVLLEHLRGIPGFEGATEDGLGTIPIVRTRFHKPGIFDQMFHTAASPSVAYLLFLVGIGLLVFEFYTAGVGIAGLTGAVAFLFGCYGLAVLPARWWAVVLLVVAAIGYAIDIQAGNPRTWTVLGTISLVVGSIALYDGVGMSWIPLTVGLVGMSLGMAMGVPTMVRARFSVPTIGRDWMIGELGEAVDPLRPEGTVIVRNATWRARTNRATPITAGAPIRVVNIEGYWLEVEPKEGGARDYRSKSGN